MDREHDATVPDSSSTGAAQEELKDEFSAGHKDVLAEVGNISMGAAATALSHMLNKRVQITTPQVSLVSMSDVRINYPIPCLVITVNYLEGLMGDNIFVLRENDALIIAGLIMGLEPSQVPDNLGKMELSAISEAMNQMMGSAATAMSEFLDRFINISPPKVYYQDLQKEDMDLDYLHAESVFIQIAFNISIEGLLDSDLLQLTPLAFGLHTAEHLLAELSGGGAGVETDSGAVKTEVAPAEPESSRPVTPEEPDMPAISDVPAAAGSPAPDASIPAAPAGQGIAAGEARLLHPGVAGPAPAAKREAPAAVFAEAGPAALNALPEEAYGLQQGDLERINLIKDIPVEISVVLGKTSLPLRQVFSLSPGEILSLESYAGEPVELLANDRLVAKGEVVLVNGKFGVKVTNIVGPKSGWRGD